MINWADSPPISPSVWRYVRTGSGSHVTARVAEGPFLLRIALDVNRLSTKLDAVKVKAARAAAITAGLGSRMGRSQGPYLGGPVWTASQRIS